MEWLSQNWIWLVLIVGVMMMLSRKGHGGMMGGCCGGHDMAHESPAKEAMAAQDTERSLSTSKHGRGGCC